MLIYTSTGLNFVYIEFGLFMNQSRARVNHEPRAKHQQTSAGGEC